MRYTAALGFAACLFAAYGPAGAAPDQNDSSNVCITGTRIDHTTVLDDQTILFVMRDHTVYRNRFAVRCLGLKNESQGFTYAPTDPGMDELCSNQMTITLNSSRNFCLIGAFEKMAKGFKG